MAPLITNLGSFIILREVSMTVLYAFTFQIFIKSAICLALAEKLT